MIAAQSSKHDADFIYTPLDEVKKILLSRRNDADLKRRVEESFHGDIPEVFRAEPWAAISRHVMSPNFELLHFLEGAERAKLKPLGLEYLQDKFVTKNEDKYYLGKMVFYEGVGKKGGRKISSCNVLDFNLSNGKKISSLRTLSGESFAEFHHALAGTFLPVGNMIDMSGYYKRNGMIAMNYYTYILSLFICHGVLFENFLLSDVYSDLTRDILLPAYRTIEARFGVRPLIVRMVPVESEEDVYWRYYPEQVKGMVYDIMGSRG